MALKKVMKKLNPEVVRGYKVNFYEVYLVGKNKKKKAYVLAEIKELNFKIRGQNKKKLMMILPYRIDRHKEILKEEEAVEKYKNSKPRIFYNKIVSSNKRYYGGYNERAEIFQHTKDGLKYLGDVKWNTAGYKGEESEVLDWLVKHGYIPKDMFPSGYYSSINARKMNVKIQRI